jgi:hypothetical protein
MGTRKTKSYLPEGLKCVEDGERAIRSGYYWHAHEGSDNENDKGTPVSLSKLREKLKNHQSHLKQYLRMPPKARRFGMWRSYGSLQREKIGVLRTLVSDKEKLSRMRKTKKIRLCRK